MGEERRAHISFHYFTLAGELRFGQIASTRDVDICGMRTERAESCGEWVAVARSTSTRRDPILGLIVQKMTRQRRHARFRFGTDWAWSTFAGRFLSHSPRSGCSSTRRQIDDRRRLGCGGRHSLEVWSSGDYQRGSVTTITRDAARLPSVRTWPLRPRMVTASAAVSRVST
jgi:hypothetical protein